MAGNKVNTESNSETNLTDNNGNLSQEYQLNLETSFDDEKLPFDGDEEMSDTEFEYSSDSDASGSETDEITESAPKLPDIIVRGFVRRQLLVGGHRSIAHHITDDEDVSDSEAESHADDIEMPDVVGRNGEAEDRYQMSEEERRIWLEVIPNRYPSVFVRREDLARMNVDLIGLLFIESNKEPKKMTVTKEATPLLKEQRMPNKRAPSLRMVLVALVVSLGGSFHFGYQLVVTNPSQAAFLSFLNSTINKGSTVNGTVTAGKLSANGLQNIWSIVVAVLFLGALAGSFSIRPIADKLGRKRGLYVSIGLGMLSAGLSILAFFLPSFYVYVASRILIGFSVSLSLGLAALFLSEASPTECRGSIGMITGVCVQCGTVIGSILAMPQVFGGVNNWYLIYVSEIGIMAVFFVFLPFFPESPRHLLQHGFPDQAKKAIEYYHKCTPEKAEEMLTQIKEEQSRSVKNYGMMDCIKKASLRRKTLIGMIVTFAMSFSGIAVINAYAVEILRSTGLSPLGASLGNVGIALVSVIAIVISSMVVDKFGRRPLLLVSFTGILVCNMFIFGLMYSFDKYKYTYLGYILIFVICVFIIFFAIGPGPLCYFITAELVGQSARSAAQSWASVVQMLCRFILVTAYLPMKNVLHSFAYLILFVAPVILSLVYLYFHLPETKNKNAEEVEEAMHRLPTVFSLTNKVKGEKEAEKPIPVDDIL